MNYKSHVRDIPDFPIPGVTFRDISPLLSDARIFHQALKDMLSLLDLSQVEAFAGIESRGFILAAALAAQSQKGFIALRKAGKLPPPVIAETYKLEYGEATLEIAPGQKKIVLVDDVLATGGTLQAAINLCGEAGYTVKDVLVLIDLPFLNQFRFQGQKIKALIHYDK